MQRDSEATPKTDRRARTVSIDATKEVDLIGYCAFETIGGRNWSASGGQADFARGAMYSPQSRALVVLRIGASLTPGSIDTTLENTVDSL